MENEVASRNLTIYLAKENRRPGTLVKDRADVEEEMLPLGRGITGRLLIKRPAPKPPSWADFFSPHVSPLKFGNVSSSSAVLLVPVYKRWAAVTFGQGRHLLSLDSFEDRFGLRVALNCIDERKIKSIDRQTFDAVASHTVEQATQEANAGEFGFDIERDILRAVTGTPKNEDYGKRLAGMESLSAQVQTSLKDLHDLLELYHQKFFDDSYRQAFPWVDQIREVTDPDLESSLNDAVIAMIHSGNLDHCWLAVPDVLDWSRVSGFRYTEARGPEHFDIHLSTFLDALRNPDEVTMVNLKQRKVFCMGENDHFMRSWPVFNCLYCELDHAQRSYVLNAGKWYTLQKDFVSQVNDSFSRVPKYSGAFADCDEPTEEKYNARLVELNRSQFCLMDRNLTRLGGAMEFCDIFSRAKELIHVKRYGGSKTLSHLFCQGVVSAEFFKMDTRYRKEVYDKLPHDFQVFDPERIPRGDEFQVVFGIISKSEKPLTIPFFSRVGIRHAVRRLRGFGYRVSLAKIGVTPNRRLLKNIRPRIKKSL